MLALLATILALIGGAIGIAAALLTRRPRRARQVGLILLAWLGGYALLLLGVSFTSRPASLALNQERCFDEMCYSLTQVTLAHTLTNPSAHTFTAQGNWYVVTLRLRNAGRGTAQKPSNPAVFVIDTHGHQYPAYLYLAGESWGQPANLPDSAIPLYPDKIQPGGKGKGA